VTGNRVNRVAGYWLEIPCVYHYCRKLEELVQGFWVTWVRDSMCVSLS